MERLQRALEESHEARAADGRKLRRAHRKELDVILAQFDRAMCGPNASLVCAPHCACARRASPRAAGLLRSRAALPRCAPAPPLRLGDELLRYSVCA